MDSNALRAKFLEFFARNGHTVVPSASLVPGDDPTLLFTNAGMVQFKGSFLGQEKRAYTRAASSQRCVRAGGKHNDLENVGYTARHHTFFEMLGNFSFGDYFKRDAIRYAWSFLTDKAWLGIDPQRLMVTVYHTDEEAFDIWHKDIGLAPDRIARIGDKPGGGSDNFWQMGDTGPCGPCSEIFFDHGPEVPGGPPGSPEEDGDRWIEIWNLVFMQFNRAADGSMDRLPAPSVDTGMGLERISAVLQGVHDNYEIDLFRTLTGAAAKLAKVKPGSSPSLKVIADHIRATAFLITDGVLPANEGRGYVLRRIMRRAIRHGYKLGLEEAFFYKLVAPLADAMGDAYPELREQRARIEQVIRQEEDSFAQTLDKGMKLLEDAIRQAQGKQIPGETAFRLYDTYGFPFDLTADIARERGLRIDEQGYDREMEAQRQRARAASGFKTGEALVYEGAASCFIGLEELDREDVEVLGLFRDGQAVTELQAGESGVVVLKDTPFYAESGGQVGDRGELRSGNLVFEVQDTQKIRSDVHGHHGCVRSGRLRVGARVRASVSESQRRATMRNHSATHLLHSALRKLLGAHVQQKGSLVDDQRTRFDFSHGQPVTPEELATIEREVNQAILANVPVQARTMRYDEAVKAGAMALFGEKYGDEVRVLQMGGFSTELCGGTHVSRTGDIGLFKILSEGGVAAGVRRIEATTGEPALAYVRDTEQRLQAAAELLRAGRDDLGDKIQQLLERQRQLEKQLAGMSAKLAANRGEELLGQVRELKGVKLLVATVEGVDAAGLRTLLDEIKTRLKSGIVVLGAASEGKAALIAGVTADLTARIKAGDLVRHVAQQVGGKGGGRPDMAQAGGSQPELLPQALAGVEAWIAERL